MTDPPTQPKHTEGELDYIKSVEQCTIRGVKAIGSGSRPPVAYVGSEHDARRLALCWNMHDKLVKSVKDLLVCVEHRCGDVGAEFEAQILLADIQQAEKEAQG